MHEVKELSFDGWGYREMDLAAKLLDKFSDRPADCGLEEPISLGFNLDSGCVFLFDGDGNTAMLNGDKLERHYSCPECGTEGFADDLKTEGSACCRRYLRDAGALDDDEETDDDETDE